MITMSYIDDFFFENFIDNAVSFTSCNLAQFFTYCFFLFFCFLLIFLAFRFTAIFLLRLRHLFSAWTLFSIHIHIAFNDEKFSIRLLSEEAGNHSINLKSFEHFLGKKYLIWRNVFCNIILLGYDLYCSKGIIWKIFQ